MELVLKVSEGHAFRGLESRPHFFLNPMNKTDWTPFVKVGISLYAFIIIVIISISYILL